MSVHPSLSVVVCAYTLKRWDDLVAACNSLAVQHHLPDEVVVVIDHNPELLARARAQLSDVTVVANTGRKGLSDARNTGIEASSGDVVLFLDDDASADVEWIANLVLALQDERVIGVGSWAEPAWDAPGRPRWFPEPFLWVVGCSYEGLSTTTAQIRNPIGCAMGFRRDALREVGGFSTTVGRVDRHPVGCEETELSIRLAQARPGRRVLHVPAARVTHRVSADRLHPSYFVRRCFWEGFSKAHVTRSVGTTAGLASERIYTTRVLPKAALKGFRDTFQRGDAGGILRTIAIVTGLTATATGYLYGQLTIETPEVVEPSRGDTAMATTGSRRADVSDAYEPVALDQTAS